MRRDCIACQYVLGTGFLWAALAGFVAAATRNPPPSIPRSGRMIDSRFVDGNFSPNLSAGTPIRPLVSDHARSAQSQSIRLLVFSIETSTASHLGCGIFEMPWSAADGRCSAYLANVSDVAYLVPREAGIKKDFTDDEFEATHDDRILRLLAEFPIRELFDSEVNVRRTAAGIDRGDVLDSSNLGSTRNYFVDEIWNTPGEWREDAITNFNRYCDIRGRIAASRSRPPMRNSTIVIVCAILGLLILASIFGAGGSCSTPGTPCGVRFALPAPVVPWAWVGHPWWPYPTPIAIVLIHAHWPMQRAAPRSESQSKYAARLRCA